MSKWVLAAGIVVGVLIGVVVGWTAAWVAKDAADAAAEVAVHEPAPAPKASISASPSQFAASSPAPLTTIRRLPTDLDKAVALYALVRSADVGALERLLDESATLPAADRLQMQAVIYSRYTELDPQAAVDRFLGPGVGDSLLLSLTFAAWAQHDFKAALHHAESLNVTQRQLALVAVWSAGDAFDEPQQAWQETLASKSGKIRSETLQLIAQMWAESAPLEALAAIDALPQHLDKDTLRMMAVFQWKEWDPGAALQWVQERPPPERDQLASVLVLLMADDSPQQAMEAALNMPAEQREHVVEMVVHRWAKDDPHAAFEWILSNQSSLGDVTLDAKPLQRIAETAPRQALALAERLDDTRRRLAISAILEQWAAADAPAAAAWLDSSPDELDRARVATIARAYVQQHGEEALDWVSAQSAQHQGRAMAQVIGELAKRSAQRALNLAERIRDPNMRGEAIGRAVYAWAAEDPPAALRWVVANSDEDSRRVALISQLFGQWARVDQDDAATQALRQVNRSERDAALAAVAFAAIRKNPDLAERLYDEVQDADLRRQVASRLARWWRETDPQRIERLRNKNR